MFKYKREFYAFFFYFKFRTRFDCISKNQQAMHADIDWCNIYHVCVGSRDNIFICPPGTIFNDTKQGCMDRFDASNCNGTRSYFKPTMKRQKRVDSSRKFQSFIALKPSPTEFHHERIPSEWKKPYESRQVIPFFKILAHPNNISLIFHFEH